MIIRIFIIAVGMVFAIQTTLLSQPDTLWTSIVDSAASAHQQIIRTHDGGFALASQGPSGRYERVSEMLAVKLDSLGRVEWRRYIDGRDSIDAALGRAAGGIGYMISQTYDGGFLVAGRFSRNGRNRSAVVRLGTDGDSLWSRSYPDEEFLFGDGRSCVAPDSNVVFTSDEHIVKVSVDNGEILWQLEIDHNLTVNDIEPVLDSGYLAIGWFGLFVYPYAIRIDAEGEIIWQRVYEGEGTTYSGIIPASAGGWCLVGGARFEEDVNRCLTRIAENGEINWQHIYPDYRARGRADVVETSDGGFAFFDKRNSYYYLSRVDYSGELLWQREYGRYGLIEFWTHYAHAIFLMENGGYLMGGFTSRGLWLVHTEADPVDIPFELEAGEEEHDYEEVTIDSVGAWEFELRNTGRRYVVIDSLWFDGDSVFACPLELPFRIEPEDSAFVLVTFEPTDDTTFVATLFLRFGDEQYLEVSLSGQGIPPNSVHKGEWKSPREISLESVYPNPFNDAVHIQYSIPKPTYVNISVFDVAGRQVVELVDGKRVAGEHQFVWQAKGIPTGLYMLRLESGNQIRTRKLMLIK